VIERLTIQLAVHEPCHWSSGMSAQRLLDHEASAVVSVCCNEPRAPRIVLGAQRRAVVCIWNWFPFHRQKLKAYRKRLRLGWRERPTYDSSTPCCGSYRASV